jgi:hypothetical protein
VRLREGLRRRIAPVDSASASKILNAPVDDDLDSALPVITEPAPASKPNFFQRLFGKKDTTAAKTEKMLKDEEQKRIDAIDPTGKTNKQIRQEKRAIKKEEKDKRQALKDKGLL